MTDAAIADKKLRGRCHLVGERHLAVPLEREADFRKALRGLCDR